MSRMTQGPQASGITHFILDSVSAGLGDLSLFAGPGLTAPGEPVSLAAPLSSACERLGWELDISNPAGECGTQTWLSPSILSEFFPELLRIMAPMCPERWVALDSQSCEQAAAKNARPVLPGTYHLLQFGVYPVLLDSQQSAIASLDRELQTLGGWVSKPAQGENLMLALPAALKRRKPGRLVVYSTDEWFRDFAGETLSTAVPDWKPAGSLEELAVLQSEADLLVVRLRPNELGVIASLWSRVPDQGMLVASGLRPQLPFLASRIELLQLPATSEELLGAVRRMLIG
jgi:hypothetical protein